MIHTVKDFSIVNEAELNGFFLGGRGFPCFFCDPAYVGNLICNSLPSLNPMYTYGRFWFTYCWSLAWQILSIIWLACVLQLYGNLNLLWHCLSLGLEWKLTSSSPVATDEFSKLAGACRWYHFNGRNWRRTKEPFDEDERREWKSWLKTQH